MIEILIALTPLRLKQGCWNWKELDILSHGLAL